MTKVPRKSVRKRKSGLRMTVYTRTIILSSYRMETASKNEHKSSDSVLRNDLRAHRISKNNQQRILDTLWILDDFGTVNRSRMVFAETY